MLINLVLLKNKINGVPLADEKVTCKTSIRKKIADILPNKIEVNLLIFQSRIVARTVNRVDAIPEIMTM